jgi:hypothetical protein
LALVILVDRAIVQYKSYETCDYMVVEKSKILLEQFLYKQDNHDTLRSCCRVQELVFSIDLDKSDESYVNTLRIENPQWLIVSLVGIIHN